MPLDMTILWNRAEFTGIRTEEDPRIPDLRDRAVGRLEAFGYVVAATSNRDSVSDLISDAKV